MIQNELDLTIKTALNTKDNSFKQLNPNSLWAAYIREHLLSEGYTCIV